MYSSLLSKYPLERSLTGIPLSLIQLIISSILSFTKASPFELIKTNSALVSSILSPSSINEVPISLNDFCVSTLYLDLPIGQNIQSKLQFFSGSMLTSNTLLPSSI